MWKVVIHFVNDKMIDVCKKLLISYVSHYRTNNQINDIQKSIADINDYI